MEYINKKYMDYLPKKIENKNTLITINKIYLEVNILSIFY